MRPAARTAPDLRPPLVKGHYREVNTGDFDVTDGIAYPGSEGTVVFVTEKPIASAALAGSPCPMTLARGLIALRNAGYLEVAINPRGRSPYFAAGVPFGGQGREEDVAGLLGALTGSRSWSIEGGLVADGRVAGRVDHKGAGGFEFDLPVSRPQVNEVSMGDRVTGRRMDEARRSATEKEVTDAYVALRRAALAGDLEAFLATQGITDLQAAAIRGLAGIDADLAVLADRFLTPGSPEEADSRPGWAQVGGRGKNSKGREFANYYEFAPCGDSLVLVGIGENPLS